MSLVRSAIPVFSVALLLLVLGVVVARRASPIADPVAPEEPATLDLEIVTVLWKDAIPAIFDPAFVDSSIADTWLRPDDQVIGVSINGDHRAYGTAFLSSREIVNDTVGGRPIMVTW